MNTLATVLLADLSLGFDRVCLCAARAGRRTFPALPLRGYLGWRRRARLAGYAQATQHSNVQLIQGRNLVLPPNLGRALTDTTGRWPLARLGPSACSAVPSQAGLGLPLARRLVFALRCGFDCLGTNFVKRGPVVWGVGDRPTSTEVAACSVQATFVPNIYEKGSRHR